MTDPVRWTTTFSKQVSDYKQHKTYKFDFLEHLAHYNCELHGFFGCPATHTVGEAGCPRVVD